MDGSSKGTVMQENCSGLLTVRIALHSGNAVVPAAGGKSGTWRMCPWADLLLQPSFTDCFQKIGPQDYDICLGTSVLATWQVHGTVLKKDRGLLGKWNSRKRSLILEVGYRRKYGAA